MTPTPNNEALAALSRYLADVASDGTVTERVVARTVFRLLGEYAATLEAEPKAQAQAAEVHLAKAIELLEQARLIAYDAHLDPTEWDLSVIAFLTLVAPSSDHAELPEPSAKA